MADEPDAIARVRLAANEHGLTEGLDPAALAWLVSVGEVETYSEGVSETLGFEQVRFTGRKIAPNAEHHRAAARQAIDRGYWKAFALASSRQRPEIEAIRDAALDAIVATEVLVDIQSIGREAEQRLKDWRPGALIAPPPEPEHHFADLMLADETRDAELDALRARIAELEAAPVLELSNEPPAEALMEAYPDEDHAALKARILAEFASLRNMLVGHIPMTMEQLARLQALEHPKFQTWLQA
jgi:hypothetical protein